jgi:hypothetical protein
MTRWREWWVFPVKALSANFVMIPVDTAEADDDQPWPVTDPDR